MAEAIAQREAPQTARAALPAAQATPTAQFGETYPPLPPLVPARVRRPPPPSTRRLARRLEDLILIKSIVRAGSINKAALQLSISQSALSRRIERLEHSFGFALLKRSQAGVEYVPGVENLDAYLALIETSIENMASWIEAQRQASLAARPPAPNGV